MATQTQTPAVEANGATPEQASEKPAGPAFPLDSFRDAAPHLRRPFTPQAVKFKIQTELGKGQNGGPPKGGMIVAYIDARLVVERLNMIVPHLWHDRYESRDAKSLICRLTVDQITREDIGEGAGKALYSDALKRAGVKFGIGVSLYAIPRQTLWAGDKPNQLRVSYDKRHLTLDERTEGWLREQYARWLEAHGTHAFGAPLDHGDVESAQGDVDADAADGDGATSEPEQPAPEPEPEPERLSEQAAKHLEAAIAAYVETGCDPQRLALKLTQLGAGDDDVRSLPLQAGRDLYTWLSAEQADHEVVEAARADARDGERDPNADGTAA